MKRVASKFVPRLLTTDQKEDRKFKSSELLERACNDVNFMNNIITGDETWVYGYDPETKQQSSQWKTPTSPTPKKARQVRSKTKVMLLAFYDKEGIVHYEYAPSGQTINKEFYVDVLRRLREDIRRKRPKLWVSGQWMIHHDGAPAHKSQLVQEFLAKHQITQIPHPPYSPDLAPCDFFLFPKLKRTLKGHRFDDIKTIKDNTTRELNKIPKIELSRSFGHWKSRWAKCVASEGEYFEGDS